MCRGPMSDNCVINCSSLCNGYFHDELWPYTREMYDMFQHDFMNTLPDMNRYGEYFAANEEYIRKYRLALPQTFKLGAVHLMMKDEAYERGFLFILMTQKNCYRIKL